MKVALIGSVSSTWTVLAAMIQAKVDVACVCGLDESRAHVVADYRSIRALATSAGTPFLPFRNVKEPEVAAFLAAHPADSLWVIGLSQLVPHELIKGYPQGGVGFHPSMLPEGRGRAPVAWTILKGARAAVNLFVLTDEADAGDIIVQREVPVMPDDYSEDLIARTNEVLGEVVRELSPALRGTGPLPATPQDHSKATYWAKRTPADSLIDWREGTEQIYRLVRAAGRPYPGAYTWNGASKLTIWRVRPEPLGVRGEPGTVLEPSDEGQPRVATSDGVLRLVEIAVEEGEAPELHPGQRLKES